MFFPVETKFQWHWYLWYCFKDYFVWGLSSCVVHTSVMSKSKLGCYGKPVSSGIIQKVSPIPSDMLVLRLYFATCPWGIHCSWSQSHSKVFVQLIKSVLMKAVPRSCMTDRGIPKEWIHFSTAAIVAGELVLITGYTIRNREKASITNRQWRLRLLGGWRGLLWSICTVRNGMVSFCHFSRGTSFLCFG